MKSITSGTRSTFVPKTKKINRLLWPDVTLNLMSGTQLQIFSMKKVEPIFASFLPEDAAPTVSTVNITIESHLWINANSLTSLKMFSAEPGSVLSERIWKESVHLPSKPEQFMSAITNSQTTKMESLRCTKSYWDIFHFGVTLKISIFCLIKVTLL
mgnify:CR=1 FL=1